MGLYVILRMGLRLKGFKRVTEAVLVVGVVCRGRRWRSDLVREAGKGVAQLLALGGQRGRLRERGEAGEREGGGAWEGRRKGGEKEKWYEGV